MPMDFPDMKSLEMAAKIWKFRSLDEEESERHYRDAVADHVQSRDPIESYEIRTGKGWDQWTKTDQKNMLNRQRFNI